MTPANPLAQGLKTLLRDAAAHGIEHLSEVETDLAQTTLLLAEAIEKLGASFMAIHAAVGAQQAVVDQLIQGAVTDGPGVGALQQIQHDIGRHVNAAVTGLQFQDMTNQLVERARSHVSGLGSMMLLLRDTAGQVADNAGEAALIARLAQAHAELAERKQQLQDGLRKAVSQTHMNSGDIELF